MAGEVNDLQKFSAGDLSAGININTSDFDTEFSLDTESKNLTTGINQGQGPRPGMSPIPAHSNKDLVDLVPGASRQRGLRSSEQTGDEDIQFVERQKFLGIVPVAIGAYDDLKDKGNVFIWILSDFENGTDAAISANLNSLYNSSPQLLFTYQFNMANGFTNNLWAQMKDTGVAGRMDKWLSPLISKLATPNNTTAPDASEFIRQYLKIDDSVFFASTAVIAVSGNKWPQQWLTGYPKSVASLTDAPTANFIAAPATIYHGTIDVKATPSGISPSWNIGDYKKNNRDITVWDISFVVDGGTPVNTGIRLMRKYVYSSYPVDDTTFIPSFNQLETNSNYLLNGPANLQIANKAGDAFVPGGEVSVLLNDPEGFCDSSYRIALVAAKKPYGFFVQDWQRDMVGRNIQIAPLTDRLHKPKTVTTLAFPTASPTYYTENGTQVSTCFNYWPSYTPATALKTGNPTFNPYPDQHVTLGAAGSGILAANTDYEFTYSIFDKQLGIETNVGAPAKFRTGVNAGVALSLYWDGQQNAGAGKYQQYSPASQGTMPVMDTNWIVGNSPAGPEVSAWANYLELRFYYRPLGSNDWLPALFIDATKYWYYPDFGTLWACVGDVAGLPGGQPGGFNDYSFLPDDTYTCVVNYKSRAFWFSQNAATFSYRNNPFAYPLRNTAPAPTGGFKGAIVHTYRGQSEQQSRLIIFGQKETYIGKFTGLLQTMPVVVSPSTIAEFEVDGSDFNVETWTSITSFSHRSAVVADGDLYWWGPEGIFKDNGVTNPTRMSANLEPDIFTLYDQSLTDEIHCYYDEKTHEIVWFYPPADANTVTHAIRFNVQNQQFFFDAYSCKIDWASRINTNNPGVTQTTNGLRTILGLREDSASTQQRGVFYDQLNRAGDYDPSKELLVKSVANGTSALEKILTLDSGIDASILATVTLGDYLACQQYKNYTGFSGVADFIGKVLSVNTGAKTITIRLPEGTGFAAQPGLITSQFFPMWHKKPRAQGLNGIPWTLQTKYWAPLGPNFSGLWLWCYMMFKYVPWLKIDPSMFDIAYRSPSTSFKNNMPGKGDFISDILEFKDNSDLNCQIFHALRPGDKTVWGNNQGQGIKLRLSGVHIGDEWVLQYLETQARLEAGRTLQMYQG